MRPVGVAVTCSSDVEARLVASTVVGERLAASAQSWPISSWFWWGGEVVERVEHLVFFKTVDDRFDGICAAVRRVHSYVLPAVVMVELSGLGPGYFEWLAESTRGGVG